MQFAPLPFERPFIRVADLDCVAHITGKAFDNYRRNIPENKYSYYCKRNRFCERTFLVSAMIISLMLEGSTCNNYSILATVRAWLRGWASSSSATASSRRIPLLPFLSSSLSEPFYFCSDDELWSFQRKVAAPMFHKKSIDEMVTEFTSVGAEVSLASFRFIFCWSVIC